MLSLRDVQIGQGAVEGFGGKGDGFRQGRMRMNRQADIGRVSAHLDGQRHFGNQIAGAGADDACAEYAGEFPYRTAAW